MNEQGIFGSFLTFQAWVINQIKTVELAIELCKASKKTPDIDAPAFLVLWLQQKKRMDGMPLEGGKEDYLKWLRKKRPGKQVVACFHTAWNEFERQLPENNAEVKELAVEKIPTVAYVESVYKGLNEGDEKDEEEVLSVRNFVTAPAYVEVSYGFTKNLGKWESFKVQRSIRIPCYVEEIDAVDKLADEWVSTRVMNEVKKIDGKKDLVPEPKIPIPKNEDDPIF